MKIDALFHYLLLNPARKNIATYFIAALAFTVTPMAFATLPFCSDIFQNGIQTHGVENYIRFNYNSQLVNASSDQLKTQTLLTNQWSIKKSCGTSVCTATGTTAPGLNFGELLETTATNEVIVPTNKKATIGANNIREYGKIIVANGAVATFAAQTQPYIISQLEVGYKSKLRLPAGVYWVSRLKLEVEGKIDVIGDGQVTLYVLDSLWVPFNFKINDNTKDPAKLFIYTASDSNYYTGSKTYAFVRSEGEIILNYKSTIVGGILGKFINLESESQVVYDPAAIKKITLENYCQESFSYVDVDSPIIDINSYDNPTPYDHITVTGTIIDSGQNATGLAVATLLIDGKTVPLVLSGNNFTLNLPLEWGDNLFTITAFDIAGNEASIPFSISRASDPEFSNVSPASWYIFQNPNITITGEVHTLLPREKFSFLLDNVPKDLIVVSEGIYRFSINVKLNRGHNKFNLALTTPEGVFNEHEIFVSYQPPL